MKNLSILELNFEKADGLGISKFGSERGISIDADSGPLGYVL